MEIKKPAESTRLSDQDLAISTINIDDFEQESRPSAYTCTFCKRGFSNAQALGGHMNVHRKDRAARLQESSIQETAQATKGSTNSMDHGPPDESQFSSDDEKGDGIIPKRPWSSFTEEEDNPESHRKKNHGVNFKKPSLQLSLCIEPSTTNESCIISSNKISTSLSSSPTEVDLELRLGIDSQATSINRVIRD